MQFLRTCSNLLLVFSISVWLVACGGGGSGGGAAQPGAIVFTSDRDGNFEVYVMNADGTGQTNLTNNSATDAIADLSPDRTRILFGSNRDGDFDIYVMNADGSSPTNLTNTAVNDGIIFQTLDRRSWSADGSKILFESFLRDGNNEIYVMDSDGTGQLNLTNDAGSDGLGAFSRDGTRVIFDSSRDGNDEIYSVNVDGTGLTNLTNNPARDDRGNQ